MRHKIIQARLCISCGACEYASNGNLKLKFIEKNGMFFPEQSGCAGHDLLSRICPGKGYDIIQIARNIFPKARNYDVDLGQWISFFACRSNSHEITKNASSGGIMTALAHYLISSGRVNGAIVTGMQYGPSGPMPEVFIAYNLQDLIRAQGSKYCPVPSLAKLKFLLSDKTNQKFVFIGTPCQIAGLRLLQNEFTELRTTIPLTIGNFCGGFKDMRETKKLIQRQGIEPRNVTFFRYRGGGQPGSMMIRTANGLQRSLPYPDYAKLTGIRKYYRCRVCVDATAELSDFSCGDAWIERFLSTGQGWSIIMTRSKTAEAIAKEMREQNLISCEAISLDELKKSQSGNLASKKARQSARRKFCRLFGLPLPAYDGGYHEKSSKVMLEMKVFISHSIFELSEKMRFYPVLAKILGRKV